MAKIKRRPMVEDDPVSPGLFPVFDQEQNEKIKGIITHAQARRTKRENKKAAKQKALRSEAQEKADVRARRAAKRAPKPKAEGGKVASAPLEKFLSLTTITDKIKSNPGLEIPLSKSELKTLARMSVEDFKRYSVYVSMQLEKLGYTEYNKVIEHLQKNRLGTMRQMGLNVTGVEKKKNYPWRPKYKKPFYVEDFDEFGRPFTYVRENEFGDTITGARQRYIDSPEKLEKLRIDRLRARGNLLAVGEDASHITVRTDSVLDKYMESHGVLRPKYEARGATGDMLTSLVRNDLESRTYGFKVGVRADPSIPVSVSTTSVDLRERVIKKTKNQIIEERKTAKASQQAELSRKVSQFDVMKQLKQTHEAPTIAARIAQEETQALQGEAISQVPFETPGKLTQSTAKMIEQDSFRAASVLHSSKMGYAAVGAAALMGIAGYNQLTGRKRRIQRDIEQG